ncbi:hypothetical protein SELR_pSRC100530 (plasmid) [Selenomonas ruminantium subsp. lactilytica TAM6421]|uniref:Uncharacterized protein n=1 Tax=Selenomonas ruminantium subsp. lactilytica (strain NBRC 103574 / TAM6421) TaxID=927704 RepID=I0GVS3_SELRL|nr:hypothetical protein SELR_pSRC100530 [Selenomonas ruminantium subsp. lactilytica TAM6421]
MIVEAEAMLEVVSAAIIAIKTKFFFFMIINTFLFYNTYFFYIKMTPCQY